MGLFRPYERNTDQPEDKAGGERRRVLVPRREQAAAPKPAATPAAAAGEPAGEKTVVSRQPQKKATATRTRAQAEAERMERRNPTLNPKEQRRADREARAKSRVDTWDRIENSPERTLLRDYVDVRWTAAEFMLPVMLLGMAAFMLTSQSVEVTTWIALGLWALMIICFINIAILWFGFRKVLAERLPTASRRGLLMYLMNRAIMLRRFRRPSPRVERGGEY